MDEPFHLLSTLLFSHHSLSLGELSATIVALAKVSFLSSCVSAEYLAKSKALAQLSFQSPCVCAEAMAKVQALAKVTPLPSYPVTFQSTVTS